MSLNTARPWRPSTLIRASVALHLAAVGTTLVRPHLWAWTLSAVVADHLVLTASGLWPRSRLLGPNWTHLPPGRAAGSRGAVAITIDDGPDAEVTPAVLDVLEAHEATATFFCIGERVEEHPLLARTIAERHHEIGNHSYRHTHGFALLGPRALAREVERAQEVLSAATGQWPRFFRAPAGLRNTFLEPVLARTGLQLVSWTRRGFDTVSRSPEAVVARLTRHLQPGDILALHDGHAARTGAGVPLILEVLPRLLTALAAAQLTTTTLRAALAHSAGLAGAPAAEAAPT
jgi:peptidoglycan/xylan/chitin deacetylase (PgdA/CDA1 family)